MENKKLSQDELDEIVQLRNEFANTFASIGSIQSRIKELEEENEENYQTLKEVQKKEAELFEKLKNSYGEGNIDLITGEFKPIQ
jgi:predicted transcriptional regulator